MLGLEETIEFLADAGVPLRIDAILSPIAFGFAETVNPSQQEGATMHPVAWTLTSLDKATEAKLSALVKKAAA